MAMASAAAGAGGAQTVGEARPLVPVTTLADETINPITARFLVGAIEEAGFRRDRVLVFDGKSGRRLT